MSLSTKVNTCSHQLSNAKTRSKIYENIPPLRHIHYLILKLNIHLSNIYLSGWSRRKPNASNSLNWINKSLNKCVFPLMPLGTKNAGLY